MLYCGKTRSLADHPMVKNLLDNHPRYHSLLIEEKELPSCLLFVGIFFVYASFIVLFT